MPKKDKIVKSSISQATSYEEIGEFWDSHSAGDYLNETHNVDIEVRVKRRHRIVLDPDIYSAVELEAHHRGVKPETLVNLWVSEKLQVNV